MTDSRAKVAGYRFALVTALVASSAILAAATPPSDFDAYVARVMQTFEVPGFGVAIVRDGAVVLTKGYGVRRLGDQTPVDARTLLGIASNTKAFTATALGLLVEEGKAEARDEAAIADADRRSSAGRDATSKPSLPLHNYAGTYRDTWYGEINVADENGTLVMWFSHTPSLVGDLSHWQHDTFVVRWRDRELRADAYVTFALNPDGSIDQAKMRAVSPATAFSFDFQDLLLKPVGSSSAR